jgi:hypothetical protein
MLQAGDTADITVNKPERDALEQVLRRHAEVLDDFERNPAPIATRQGRRLDAGRPSIA